ncbi:choline dehydrogenase [Streptomyces sp. V4I23]|uniref:GMC family oxidoreductase n=1 Tax=Streptomyces sp. V4I23 TaxID=3042282 RepID=UPI0027880AE4|nr:GMC family oxidoreductase N-terminal domain-containing protein [Streptomyces sp. V4I23]MDQ1005847.1 choline dehydrogenase [Streptomyces sp. V4I23]
MQRFDHIVVGAGSSGAVLAARLSQEPQRQVLLIEAGPDYPHGRGLPTEIEAGTSINLAKHIWGYRAQATAARDIPFPSGRAVGGSSAINACVAVRGEPEDYYEWADQGNPGWGWKEFLATFIAMEDDTDFDGPYHGHDGPIPIRRWPNAEISGPGLAFEQTCVKLGFEPVADHNEPGAAGVGPAPVNLHGTRRVSTAGAYVDPARHRDNLHIMPQCTVSRVVVRNGRAVGVEIITHGNASIIDADRVTICAGAIGTPAILLRSGIGPAAELRHLGIVPAVDLPGVGRNLHDHPACGVDLLNIPGGFDSTVLTPQMLLRGNLTSSDHRIDAQLSVYAIPAAPVTNADAMPFRISCDLLNARSAGRVTLTSTAPLAPPRIELNYFEDPADLAIMRAAVRLAIEIASTSPLNDRHNRFITPEHPDTIATDTQLDAYIRAVAITHFHPTGTAKMGPDSDPVAVVDNRCQVYGINGLSIVDASIIPTIVRANTNLTCIALAELAAQAFS